MSSLTNAETYAKQWHKLSFDPETEQGYLVGVREQIKRENTRRLLFGGFGLLAFIVVQNFFLTQGMPPFSALAPYWTIVACQFLVMYLLALHPRLTVVSEYLQPLHWVVFMWIGVAAPNYDHIETLS